MTTTPTPSRIDDLAAKDHEYIHVEVTRSEGTGIYMKVPKGWRPKRANLILVANAANATTDRTDWEKDGWEHTVEIQSVQVVDEDEAKEFRVFDAVAALSTNPKN